MEFYNQLGFLTGYLTARHDGPRGEAFRAHKVSRAMRSTPYQGSFCGDQSQTESGATRMTPNKVLQPTGLALRARPAAEHRPVVSLDHCPLKPRGEQKWQINILMSAAAVCSFKCSITLRSLSRQTSTRRFWKKLGFAPKNESYIINIVRFLKLIDDKGARTDKAQKTFTLHDEATFQKAFSEIVKSAYSDLFSLHGDGAWSLDDSKLITFFRQSDQSSELVGSRQAGTFKTLATYAGHAPTTASPKGKATKREAKPGKPRKPQSTAKAAATASAPLALHTNAGAGGSADDVGSRNLGLTVRIEINLPATGDQETYDKIFKSIRENLLNG